MKKKTKMLIILISIICASSIFFSYSYFTRVTTSTNIITFGSLKLKLINNTLKNGKEVPVLDNKFIDISSTGDISRIVRIKNIGKHPMFIRVYLDVTVGNKKLDEENIIKCLSFDIGDNWIYQDGFYYYNPELNPDEETSNLFTTVQFNIDKIKSFSKGKKVDFKVNVQAVQSENNEGEALKANGWPERK